MAVRHKKRRLEPISLEELENSASITGLEAVLRFEVPVVSAPAVPTVGPEPTVGVEPTVCPEPAVGPAPTVSPEPTPGPPPTVGLAPTVGPARKIKRIVVVEDALTAAGALLYRCMHGEPSGAAQVCAKGYRQLAAETRLDKDTVRDLIVEFKTKGILVETATYDPDTRSSKTYRVLSPPAILDLWRHSGIFHVTGRRPILCDPAGTPLTPTVGL